jgi:hypothetical protein
MSWTCKPGPEAQRGSEALSFDLLKGHLIFIPNIPAKRLALQRKIMPFSEEQDDSKLKRGSLR